MLSNAVRSYKVSTQPSHKQHSRFRVPVLSPCPQCLLYPVPGTTLSHRIWSSQSICLSLPVPVLCRTISGSVIPSPNSWLSVSQCQVFLSQCLYFTVPMSVSFCTSICGSRLCVSLPVQVLSPCPNVCVYLSSVMPPSPSVDFSLSQDLYLWVPLSVSYCPTGSLPQFLSLSVPLSCLLVPVLCL